MHRTFGHAGPLGDVVFDNLIVNDGKSQPISHARGDFISAGAQFARHRNDGHGVLPLEEQFLLAQQVAGLHPPTEPRRR